MKKYGRKYKNMKMVCMVLIGDTDEIEKSLNRP